MNLTELTPLDVCPLNSRELDLNLQYPTPIVSIQQTLNDHPQMIGIGQTLFFQGCHRRCPGCQNRDLQPMPTRDQMRPLGDILRSLEKDLRWTSYISMVGGEPALYLPVVEAIVHWAQFHSVETILYTGYRWDRIQSALSAIPTYVVDGLYEEDHPSVYKMPASSNQKVFFKGSEIDPSSLLINRSH